MTKPLTAQQAQQTFLNDFLDKKDRLSDRQIHRTLSQLGNTQLTTVTNRLYADKNSEDLRALFLNVYLTSVIECDTNTIPMPVYFSQNRTVDAVAMTATDRTKVRRQIAAASTPQKPTKAPRSQSPKSVMDQRILRQSALSERVASQKQHQFKLTGFLDRLCPEWRQAFPNDTSNPSQAQQRISRAGPGTFAQSARRQGQEDFLPPSTPDQTIADKLRPFELQKHSNGGGDGLCLLYAVIMGATGLDANSAKPWVEELQGELGLASPSNPNSHWFSSDDEAFISDILPAIEALVGQSINLVTLSDTDDKPGFIISGRSSKQFDPKDELLVVIHQSRTHYEAVW